MNRYQASVPSSPEGHIPPVNTEEPWYHSGSPLSRGDRYQDPVPGVGGSFGTEMALPPQPREGEVVTARCMAMNPIARPTKGSEGG